MNIRLSRRVSSRILIPLGLAAALLIPAAQLGAQQAPGCQFVLGFQTLRSAIPSEVGDCLENQGVTLSGDAQQRTTKGLMVWRRADNWTAFTNGYRTWINGPNGVEDRLNTDRFPWEAAAPPASSAPPPPPVPTAVPQPVATPKGLYAWSIKKVTDAPALCGISCVDSAPNRGTQYIGGHVIKRDGTAASGMIVQAQVENNLLTTTTGDDGAFSIILATNCPAGPINADVYIVDGALKLSSYTNHVTYLNCQQAGEFHFDFAETAP